MGAQVGMARPMLFPMTYCMLAHTRMYWMTHYPLYQSGKVAWVPNRFLARPRLVTSFTNGYGWQWGIKCIKGGGHYHPGATTINTTNRKGQDPLTQLTGRWLGPR